MTALWERQVEHQVAEFRIPTPQSTKPRQFAPPGPLTSSRTGKFAILWFGSPSVTLIEPDVGLLQVLLALALTL